MTFEEELFIARRRMLLVRKILEETGLRLKFNGELSPDEMRMAEQCTFVGPASWEVEE